MKISLFALVTSVGFASAGLTPLGEHLDIRCHFSGGEWITELVTDTEVHTPEESFLPLSDRAYSNSNVTVSGARHTQPSNAAFAFTGATPGSPIWLAVQGFPGIGEAWPGFRNDQTAGTFGSYIPSDTRVSQGTPRPWIRVQLDKYEPPAGVSSDFSMWSTSTGQPPSVWMSTHDTSVENSYYFAAGSHSHLLFGFTAQGVHRVTFTTSAYLGPGETNPTGLSEPFTLVFAVGTTGRWQAEWFDPAQLADANVSGLSADPDNDGLTNLVEYAFGTNPLQGGAVPIAEGLGMPAFSLVQDGGTIYETVTYPRRRAGTRILPEIYKAYFSSTLDGSWSTDGVTTSLSDFPAAQSALNAGWERVTSRRPVSGRDTQGFVRVGVDAGDGLSN